MKGDKMFLWIRDFTRFWMSENKGGKTFYTMQWALGNSVRLADQFVIKSWYKKLSIALISRLTYILIPPPSSGKLCLVTI